MKKLIFWNTENEVFLKKFYDAANDIIINNYADFECLQLQTNDKSINNTNNNGKIFYPKDFDCIIILAELFWDEKNRNEYFGVQIAMELRINKLKHPIFFVSHNTPKYILDFKISAEIIATIGTAFLSIDGIYTQVIESALQKTKPLNDIQLADIIHNYCTLKGIVGNKFHDLKNLIKEDLPNKETAKKTAINGLEDLKKIVIDYKLTVRRINELIINIERNEMSIEEFCNNTEDIITASLHDNYKEEEQEAEKEWAVLILDDQISEIEKLKGILEKKGIKKIFCTDGKSGLIVSEAKKIIAEDVNNSIVVAIADFRLLDKNAQQFCGIKHQEEQGYDFLVWLSQQDRHNRLVALSGLSRKFLQKSFRNRGVRVSVFSKNDLTGSGIHIFADEIEEYGEETFQAILHKPLSAGWLPMVPFYRYHRNNLVYEQVELDVSKHAQNIVNKIKRILKNDEQEINTPIHELKDITANLKNNKKPENPEHFSQFKNKLIARRVALWLLYCENFKREQVASVLLEQAIIFDFKDNTRVSQLFSQMGLDMNDFPYNILVEEKRWLKECMGIDIYTLEDVLTQIGVHFEEALEKYFKIYKKIPDDILKEGCIINENNKIEIVIYSYCHGKSLLEKIFEIIDESSKAEFLNIVDELIQKIETDEHCKNYLVEMNKVILNLREKIRYLFK